MEPRSGHVTSNVWDYMFIHGVVRIEGRFTVEKYIYILQNLFLPSLQRSNFPFPPRPVLFVQDRCPIHTTRIVTQWFNQQENLQLLEWPSKGCDCNPIEHLWANMVNCWEPNRERTAEQLMEHTRDQWELFRGRQQLIRTLVTSMPDRLRGVIEKNGGWIHYWIKELYRQSSVNYISFWYDVKIARMIIVKPTKSMQEIALLGKKRLCICIFIWLYITGIYEMAYLIYVNVFVYNTNQYIIAGILNKMWITNHEHD